MGENIELSIPKDLKIGDYVEYSPTIATDAEKTTLRSNWIKYSGATSSNFNISKFQQENLKWRVFEIDRFQENYFLSSRNALVSISNVSFGVRYVTKGLPAAIILYNSQNTNASVSKFKLRPIIEILSPSRLKQVNGTWTI